jgi:acetyl-CoA/propionyl-CoA carboxylase biotin carboxyl carrier protein
VAWIGPPPEAIEVMGDKISSRKSAAAANVESVPGTLEPIQNVDEIIAFGEQYGWPVAIKAAYGGGGRGMKVVADAESAAGAFESAQREAQSYFGRPECYMERYLTRPRHVELQIFCDTHGNAVYLGERDCSTQRRHQKVLEETPSPAVKPKVRAQLTQHALRLAGAVGYQSAGTCEFLLTDRGEVFFLEMNTRLQVEHPVTEAVAGVDLVRAQFIVADGGRLPWAQDTLAQRGHAIECRVYAEDPTHGFLPQAGPLRLYREPSGPGVRVDSGVTEGDVVGVNYDPLLAKLIVHAETREAARMRAVAALRSYPILGTRTNIPFLLRLLELPAFRAGSLHTGMIEEHMSHMAEFAAPDGVPAEALVAAALAAAPLAGTGRNGTAQADYDPWSSLGRWGR